MPFSVVLPFLAGVVGAKLQNKRDKKAYSAAEAKNEQRRSDYYVNLRNAAEKGGFNPLTALRSGGGMGYSNLAGRLTQPLMTRSPIAAGIAAGTSAYTSLSMTRMNQQHDEKMARLKSDLYRADALAIHKGTQPVDPYAGYTDKIPVKFGFKEFKVPVEIAKRLRVEPNDRVSAGEIAELMGEAAEVVLAFASAGMDEQYEMMQLELLGGEAKAPVTVSKLEPAENPFQKKLAHEKFMSVINRVGDILDMDANWRTRINQMQGF